MLDATLNVRSVPLSQLRASARNVRKAGGASIDDLAASILAHGLLQNLSVQPSGEAFEVVAGGRRLAALQRLADSGTVPLDLPVPCRIVEPGSAHEASLAENVIRQAMHPADEFEAFGKLACDENLSAAAIAERFGTNEKHVAQRLKLANVAPEILAEYRRGKADLEQMMALALTDDQEAQRRVWAAGKGQPWKRYAHNLKQALTEGEVRSDDKLARYVGAEAYQAAGGVIRKDLFAEERDVYFTDRALLTRLAEEKLQRTADKLAREGWAWTEARISFDYSEQSKFGSAPSERKGTKQTWSAEAKATAGVIVTIGWSGQAEISRGLVRPEDRRAAAKATGKAVEGGKAPKAAKKPDALSFAQVQRLQGFRTAVLRSELATQPRIALAALAADLAMRLLRERDGYAYGGPEPIVRIGADNHFAATPIREGLEAAARPELEQLEDSWRQRLAPHKADIFAWLLEQPESTTHELLACLVASRILAGDNTEQQTDRGQLFAHVAGADMAAHWQVTEEWLAAQPKPYVLAAVAEACGKKAAEPLAKLKKADAARRAAELITAAEPKWLPKPLRAPKAKPAKKAKTDPAEATA